MNKTLIAIAVVAFISVGSIITFLVINSSNMTNDKEQNTVLNNSSEITPAKACDFLSKSLAKETLGTEIKTQTTAPVATENEVMIISLCNYTSSVKDNNSGVSLMARSAKNEQGIEFNKDQFESTRPPGTEDVDNLGDKAYFVRNLNQLNILIGGNWYTIAIYSNTDDTLNSLDNERNLAQKMNLE